MPKTIARVSVTEIVCLVGYLRIAFLVPTSVTPVIVDIITKVSFHYL
ncbi:MAG: hypothetical protein NZ961_21935 [Candidatus Poribacteria bacterium]|nr:hypothetical protein [Candidatus Poribacteria bacterium]